MKKSHTIFFIFLGFGLILIIISIFLAQEGLREVTLEKGAPGQAPAQNISGQRTIPPPVLGQQEKAKPESLEFDRPDEISDDYVIDKNRESQEAQTQEDSASGGPKLNKQPSWDELKGLKVKGVVIY